MKMSRRSFSLISLLALALGCATAGIPAGDAQKGYVVWGFLGHGAQTPAVGQELILLDEQGQPVQRAVSDGTGKYVLAYHPPGRYSIQVGQLAMPVMVGAADQRLDIDLTNPTGVMNYAQQPPPRQGSDEPARSDGSSPSVDSLDSSAPEGSDCWASAGCDYDSSTGTYTYD